MLFNIDEMHVNDQAHYSQACFINNYIKVSSLFMRVNSSATECSNSELNHIRKSLSIMSQKHAILLTYMYLCMSEIERKSVYLKQKQKSV